MGNRLYLAVAAVPDISEIGGVAAGLRAYFGAENESYMAALSGSGEHRLPERLIAARLGALQLLPRLLERARVEGHALPRELRLRRNGEGRPYAEALCPAKSAAVLPFDFNLSHSAAHVGCALLVGPGRVGLDMEEPIPPERAGRMLARYATAGERALANAHPGEWDFLRIWVTREAMGKQAGVGRPLEQDASRIPAGLTVHHATLPDTGAQLALCSPAGEAILWT